MNERGEVKMIRSYRFGIEMETTFKEDDYPEVETATENLGFNWGSDASINPSEDYDSVEIRTTGGRTFEAMKTLMDKFYSEVIKNYSFKTNASCGLHVHTSHPQFASGLYIKRLVYFWSAIEDILIATQPVTRNNNQYCRRLLRKYVQDNDYVFPEDKDEVVANMGGDRYFTLNLTAYTRHKTLEVRLHAGTINRTKIMNWIVLLRAIYEYVANDYSYKQVSELFDTEISEEKIDKFFELIRVDDSIVKFYKARILKFKQLDQLKSEQKQASEEVAQKIKEIQALKEFSSRPTAYQLNKLRRISDEEIDRLLGAT